MQVREIYDWLDAFAPFSTAADFDNAGLLMGAAEEDAHGVLFTVDATLAVVQEAVSLGANVIVAHHPLMFGGTKQIRYDQPEGQTIAAMASAKLHFIAAHTNLDQAQGGTGDALAQAVGLEHVRHSSASPYLCMGELPKPVAPQALLEQLRKSLNANVRMYGDADRPLRRVGVGAGSLGGDAALAAEEGAQAYVVGEIQHHQLIDACARGLTVYEAGHYATEHPGIAALYERFRSEHSDIPTALTQHAPYRGATLAP